MELLTQILQMQALLATSSSLRANPGQQPLIGSLLPQQQAVLLQALAPAVTQAPPLAVALVDTPVVHQAHQTAATVTTGMNLFAMHNFNA